MARACLHDDMAVVDHRPASSLGVQPNVESYFASVTALIEVAADVRWSGSEDIELSGTVGRATLLISGHMNAGGGWAEIPFGVVWTCKGERMDRFELYPPDAVAEQRARVAELRRSRRP